VGADEPLEKAALIMEEKKIGGLPVMEGDRLVGIITVTDVLRAFIEVLGLRLGGLRITVDIPDIPGALAQMAQAVPSANIVSIATAAHLDGYQRLVMRVVGEDVEGVPERLKAAGERVVDVRPG
jgi:acetoin utilization protein AcuB